ncbi:hypothetical protein CerSpe_170350 [Prunus speciosa]
MNLLSWNCQGLGNPSTIQALSSLIRQQDPKLVFLSETRCNKSKLEIIKFRLGFSKMFVVPSRGFSGGLCQLWRDDVDLSILSYSFNHIDTVCDNFGIEGKWRLTGFYGCPQSADRSSSWNLLSTLGQQVSLPWICFGNFNEILSVNEKRGGLVRANRLMEAFQSVLSNCELSDLGFVGCPFTWSTSRSGGISCRLDLRSKIPLWSALSHCFPAKRSTGDMLPTGEDIT